MIGSLVGLLNPPRRSRKGRRSHRRASPAQIAHRKRFAAMARSGVWRKRRSGRRRSAGTILAANTRGASMARRRRRSLRRRVHHRRRVVAIVNDPGRRRRRRHASRNFGTRKGYRRGITRHVRRSGRRIVPGYRSISRNPGLSAYAGIRHRRRRHGRRNVRYSVRHAIIRRNPLKMGLGTFKELINKDFLIDAATVAGGALGTRVLTGFVLSKLNKTAWNSGVTGYAWSRSPRRSGRHAGQAPDRPEPDARWRRIRRRPGGERLPRAEAPCFPSAARDGRHERSRRFGPGTFHRSGHRAGLSDSARDGFVGQPGRRPGRLHQPGPASPQRLRYGGARGRGSAVVLT